MGYKIIVADDHKIVYEGLRMLIQSKLPDAKVEGVVDLMDLKSKIERIEFDLIILDINLPGGNVRQFVESYSMLQQTPIIIFSAYEERVFATVFIKAGAWGYVEKGESPETIFEAIKDVLAGKKYLSKSVKEILMDIGIKNLPTKSSSPQDSLSARELEVAHLLVSGFAAKSISVQLGLSTSAIGTYKKRIFDKLRIKNVMELSRLFEKTDGGELIL